MPTPVIVIVGPTAVGKTGFALSIAEMLDTEIISADSMQVYRGMTIGVAAPSADGLARVRHHFVGAIELGETFSAADFARGALAVVNELNSRGKVPLVVGGSGLYVRALVDGLFPGPPADKLVRRRLENMAGEQGERYLHERLERVDPASATTIHPHDLRRIVRALEVFELTGIPISRFHEMHQETKPHLDAMFIGLERARQDLYRRIDERVEQMFERGLVGEVANLLERGYGAEIDRIRPLGYPEVKAYLLGQIDLDRAKYLIQRNSRRYAKRQYTWFRSDPRIRWFLFGADEEPADHAMQVCRDVGIIQSQVAAAPRQAND